MTSLKQYFEHLNGETETFFNAVRDRKNISAFGLHFADKTIISSMISPCVYVCADYVSSSKAYEQFCAISDNVCLLTAKDDVLSYRQSQSGENSQRRLAALLNIAKKRADIIVTSADALTQLYPHRQHFLDAVLYLEKGKDYTLEDIIPALIKSGYKRESQVTAKGHFSLRGDILDIWPPDSGFGYRLEFFGDELESIKSFDVSEQTTTGEIEIIEICPNTEIFLNSAQAETLLEKLKKDMPQNLKDTECALRAENIISDISIKLLSGGADMSLSFLLPLTENNSFFDFVKPERIIFDEAKQVYDNLTMHYLEHNNRYKSLLIRGEVTKSSINQLVDNNKVFNTDCQKIAFHSITSQNRIFNPQIAVNFSSVQIPSYSRNLQSLFDDINGWLSQDYNVVLFCGNDAVKQNFTDSLSENKVGHNTGGKGFLSIISDELPYGAIFHTQKLVLIGTFNLISKIPKKIIKRKKSDVFIEPSVGSYVVHNIHGIGFCESVTRLDLGGASRDYFVVKYQGDDKLYVPIENMDSLTKFVSGDENPRLSKIGGADFARQKEKVKSSVKEMALGLTELYAKRKQAKGYAYSDDDTFLNEFSAGFPYTETEDQLDAINDGLKDLKTGKIMDRLLCGDVGYGKTEVALRLAFKVITEGKQVAFISPTTILARQHFNTVKDRMESFGVRIASLTRFDSPKSISESLEKISSGEADIIIGTHRVLSADVKFKDLGFLILDEEQRFGVADKEKIKKLKVNVNVLSLSATPIPRTLHMSLVGVRDISILDTPPAMRIPVQTYVTEYTDSLVIDAATREINRGGQVFIVYNRVETIARFAAKISSLLPDFKIAAAHGQMKEEALENVIAQFIGGGTDILIATTIIENGIDMPNANTMIIVDSDRFGLSQLYQLRGRIGRSDRLAYVYFTFNAGKMLTETAYKRLDAITEYTEFGSGFKIAMRDLEIRGAGNILGREQHGHIEKVGYDMYCKLLENAVREMSGEGTEEKTEREIKVNTDYNAFIPESYIPDNEWRIRVYSRISTIGSNEQRAKLTADLEDIYGKLPASVENLLLVAMVKNLAANVNATSVTLKRNECSLNFSKTLDIPEIAAAMAGKKLDGINSKINFGQNRAELIKFLINCQTTSQK